MSTEASKVRSHIVAVEQGPHFHTENTNSELVKIVEVLGDRAIVVPTNSHHAPGWCSWLTHNQVSLHRLKFYISKADAEAKKHYMDEHEYHTGPKSRFLEGTEFFAYLPSYNRHQVETLLVPRIKRGETVYLLATIQ